MRGWPGRRGRRRRGRVCLWSRGLGEESRGTCRSHPLRGEGGGGLGRRRD